MENKLNEFINSLDEMIKKTDNMKPKFEVGTSQHTLLNNRGQALAIIKALIEMEMELKPNKAWLKIELINAIPPIVSLISKNEKVINKLESGSWQFAMTTLYLKALNYGKNLLIQRI